ncbi:hypothetical protein ACH4VX_11735 [Streptomyces sp. NPDC020731]|uniref:hypothetical protein n=1 Tax=Streptomyces sp. NPDC020731 TaxID=3365085 RepID=UPI0037B35377
MNIALTSGVALGTYIPGLLLDRALSARELPSRVYVLEKYFPDEARKRIQIAKGRYSRDYRLAKAAHALATDHTELITPETLAALFDEWDAAEVGSVTVLSGFWTEIVAAYVDRRPDVLVDVCHVDAVPSPSHRHAAELTGSTHTWLLDARTNTLNETIPVTRAGARLPWESRSIGFLAHGGGWGMGTHAAAASRLVAEGQSVSLILPEPWSDPPAGLSTYHQDPSWETSPGTAFPRLVAGPDTVAPSFGSREHWADTFELTRRSRAVVSKPGAGTLIDSLNAATPVLFTEALGGWELANERVWCALGFGMRLSEWLDKRDPAVLRAMHERLHAARDGVASYPDRIAARGVGRRSH